MASKGVPEGGLGQQPSGVGRVVDVLDGRHRVPDPELDDGIHVDCHTVLGQNLGGENRHPKSTSYNTM